MKTFVAFISTIFLFASCSSSKHATSHATPGVWQAQPITIDGDSKDWPAPYPSYDSKALIAYAASNDKDNLYITMETGDIMTQIKILTSGLTVWIDTSGRKEEGIAIHYPMQSDNTPFGSEDLSEWHSDRSGGNEYKARERVIKMKQAANNATQMSIEGLSHCNGGYLVT